MFARRWSELGRRAKVSASIVVIMLIAIVVALLGGSSADKPKVIGATTSTSSAPTTTERHPAATAAADRQHPNPALTPGAIFADITRDQVCVRGYSASVRAVSDATRDEVFAEYGLTNATSADYQVDHLISLELGGSNDITNLWPQPLNDPSGNGAEEKDQVENDLHSLVCSGEVSLTDAQHAIVHWDTIDLASLVSTTTTTPPATTAAAPPPPAAPAPTTAPAADCTPGYDPCIPPGPDVDCAGGNGDGPRYVQGPVYVTGSDPYRLDGNHDGVACE